MTTRKIAVSVSGLLLLLMVSCGKSPARPDAGPETAPRPDAPPVRSADKVIHIFVALCDNKSQGIVPVPAKIGNGEDPDNNLYWGAAYGVKTFFRKSADWRMLSSEKGESEGVLERLVFRHRGTGAFLVADGYRGAGIRQTIQHFLEACAGWRAGTVRAGDRDIPAGGAAAVLVYVGHNGLMDFRLPETPARADGATRQAIVLCCKSRQYFAAPLAVTGARPLLLTTGFMAPEAYTLEAALAGWVAGNSEDAVARRAAEAYHRYQKCGLAAANRLFSGSEE